MKTKNIGIAVAVLAVVVVGALLVSKIACPKNSPVVKGKAPVAKTAAAQKTQVKKAISKDMGALTVKILNSKGAAQFLRARVFRSTGSKTSVYAAPVTSNRIHELAPGTYDIEIDTVPQIIYKDVRVARGKEIVVDPGLTGAINVKAVNSENKNAAYAVRILYPKSNIVVTRTSTNKPVELVPGLYDVEIATLPVQSKKEVKVAAGKETVIDIGCTTGRLTVKVVDENAKEVRYAVRVKRSDKDEVVASGTSNRPIEIMQGKYNVEILSSPTQSKKDVIVGAGETAVAEFTVQTPASAVKK